VRERGTCDERTVHSCHGAEGVELSSALITVARFLVPLLAPRALLPPLQLSEQRMRLSGVAHKAVLFDELARQVDPCHPVAQQSESMLVDQREAVEQLIAMLGPQWLELVFATGAVRGRPRRLQVAQLPLALLGVLTQRHSVFSCRRSSVVPDPFRDQVL
jgi:hypothetical protein